VRLVEGKVKGEGWGGVGGEKRREAPGQRPGKQQPERRLKDSDIPALIPAEEQFKPAPVHRKQQAGSSPTVEGTKPSTHEHVDRRSQEVSSRGASPSVRKPPSHTAPSGAASPLVRKPPNHTALSGCS